MKTQTKPEGGREPLTAQSANPLQNFVPQNWSGWNVGENRWLDHFYDALKTGDTQRAKGLLLVGLNESTHFGLSGRDDWSRQQRIQFYMRLCWGITDRDVFDKHNGINRDLGYASYGLAQVAFNALCDNYFAGSSKTSFVGDITFRPQGYRHWLFQLLTDGMIEYAVSFFVSDEMKLQNSWYHDFPKHREPFIKEFLCALAEIVFNFSSVKFFKDEKRGLSDEGVALERRVHALQPKCLAIIASGRWWHLLRKRETKLCKEALLELKRLSLRETYIYVGQMNDYGKDTLLKALANGDEAAITLAIYSARLKRVCYLRREEAKKPAKSWV